jgi:hypothetical protein
MSALQKNALCFEQGKAREMPNSVTIILKALLQLTAEVPEKSIYF